MESYRIEYRVAGRFRGDTKRHCVDGSKKWTKEDAERRLRELQQDAEYEIENKKRKVSGMASTEYYSEYDLLELRIESRKVSKWE